MTHIHTYIHAYVQANYKPDIVCVTDNGNNEEMLEALAKMPKVVYMCSICTCA
jgi:hypothetical protein